MSAPCGYTVRIKRSAEKEQDRLPAYAFERVTRVILRLARGPRPPGSQKRRGMQHHRLRAGQYRILYAIDGC